MPCVPFTPDEILKNLFREYGPEGLHEMEKTLMTLLVTNMTPTEDSVMAPEYASELIMQVDDLRQVIAGTRSYYQCQNGKEMHHA